MVHPSRQDAARSAAQAEACLKNRGVEIVYPQRETLTRPPELVLTFGGDGTLLAGAHVALKYGIPLLGINLGTVGFLTEEEPENLQQALERLLSGDYTAEERSLLSVHMPAAGKTFLALNDAVVTRGGYARLIRVEARVNDALYDVFTADGLIVATPTGSTGYSLSAGGPIVEPSMSCMVLTPVCAHSLRRCPIIVSDTSEIRLRLQTGREQSGELQIDGVSRGNLAAGDEIVIRGTERKMKLLRLHPYDFFSLMRTKLTEWTVT